MANIKSAKKRILVTETITARNKAIKSRVKTYVKKVEAAVEAKDAFTADNKCYTIESSGKSVVTNPKGTLYMTANSASGSKYYELINSQQDYIEVRSQNWLPSYSVIDLTKDDFKITTYQITDEGKVENIDNTFTIHKTVNR